jgi:Na+/proline symporter
MCGAVGAAYFCVNLPEVGGVGNLITHPNVVDKINIFPDFDNKEMLITLIIIPLAVQWWSSWFPGAEPGGGGYIAQRMLAAKDENHAIGATFFFNVMHYALRPWPWILVALASLVVFPDIASIQEAFPNITDDKLGHDLAYSAMLTKLPNGLLGLVLASLVAAYMSTISTHLNWGSSYIVNDFYKQQINKNASEKRLVAVGRLSTVVLMVVSATLALFLQDAVQIFKFIIMFGAGTGLIFILRWFWWRINAWSEISAMFSSGIVSIIFGFTAVGDWLFTHNNELGVEVLGIFPSYAKFPMVVLITTIIWLSVTFLTKPEKSNTLYEFYKKIQPGGPGWEKTIQEAKAENIEIENTNQPWSVPSGIIAMILAMIAIYSAMFATGYWIYGSYVWAVILTISGIISGILLSRIWKKIKAKVF